MDLEQEGLDLEWDLEQGEQGQNLEVVVEFQAGGFGSYAAWKNGLENCFDRN